MAILKDLIVQGVSRFIGDITASKIFINGGTSTQFLKADGTLQVLESKASSSNGTDVSLVTTGEKAVWNAKQNALTNPVTGTGLTADKIVLGNGTTTVKTSSKGITTTAPTSTSDDTTIPTSKAVWDVITNHSHSDYEDYLTDLQNKVSMSITTTGVRGHIESSPTLLSYTGDKNSINNILSHFKLGWFDGNGNLVKECAPGRISEDINGNSIAIDGSVGDLMVYVDTDIYVDRATVNNVTIPDSSASSHNIIGLGLVPHKFGDKVAKKFEPFGFAPHHAKSKNSKLYSYYNNESVDRYTSGLNNSIKAISKGGGYMGLYYEFYEIWYIAMYLELGTLDFTRNDLFGQGCTNNIPTSSNWYSNSIEGGGGILLSSGTYDKYSNNGYYTNYGTIPVILLDPLYIMDGIVKAGFQDQIGGTTLYTHDNNGDVILVTDTNPSSWESASGMTQDKKYFTVKNVNGCQGISDGVMTGIVNVYTKKETYIEKVSYVVYRGAVLLDGLNTHVVGLNYVTKHTGTTKSPAQSEQIFYADSWKDVPTDTSLYVVGNTYITADSEEGLNENPLFVQGYKKSEEFPVSNTFSGWIKEADYNISIFAFKTFGASQHTYECGQCWSQGISDSISGISDNSGINTNAKIVNTLVVGGQGNQANAGRTCNNTFSLNTGHVCLNVGFSHPQIKL